MKSLAPLAGVIVLLATPALHAAPPVTSLDDAAIAAQLEAWWEQARRAPDEAPFEALLRSGDLAALEQKLEAVQADYEAGKGSELWVYSAFHVFGEADLEAEIERWAEGRPKAWTARVARALSHHARGNRLRGGGYAHTVPAEDWEAIRSHLAIAERDYRAALEQRPRFLPAYNYLIQIHQHRGDREGARAVLEQAMRRDPASSTVRGAYLASLQPKWGGSWEAMEQFAQESQEHVASNPRLVSLLGEPIATRGYERLLQRDWAGARDLFTEAMRFGREPMWLKLRADAYKRLERWEDAAADLTEAIRLDPDHAELYASRAGCNERLDRRDAAIADWARAVELEPDEFWMVKGYARAYEHALRGREAIAVFERFLANHPDHVEAYERMADLYRQSLRQPERARDLLKRVIEVEPERASAWRNYGNALFELRDPGARAAYTRFLELAETGEPIDRAAAPVVRRILETLPPASLGE